MSIQFKLFFYLFMSNMFIHGLHFVTYYLSWVSCVYFAMKQQPWLGPLLTVVCLFIQIIAQITTHKPWKSAFIFALFLMSIGTILDTIWLHAHFITFNANPFAPFLSPPWMMALWLSFGFYLIVSGEKWLKHLLWLGLLTLISVPWGYWLGVIAGVITLHSSYWFYLILGLTWMITLPLICYLRQCRLGLGPT